jgi:hypothetical protein
MNAIVSGALVALTVTAASAAQTDQDCANYMLPLCKLTIEQALADKFNSFQLGQCLGIVSGIREMFGALKDAQMAGSVKLDDFFCTAIPDRVTNKQLVNVVVKFGEEHPNVTHEPFVVFAMAAIRAAWPCKK